MRSALKSAVHKIRKKIRCECLGGKGERVDINLKNKCDYRNLDACQRSHYCRYEFAASQLQPDTICGDFACGTGYGSVIMAQYCEQVVGMDINLEVIREVKERYQHIKNIEFLCGDLLESSFELMFDQIVSFETIEHVEKEDAVNLLRAFSRALKANGRVVFSTPYMQEETEQAKTMGFHRIFNIDKKTIESWLQQAGFNAEAFFYQKYEPHDICLELEHPDFIICIARKVSQ